MTEADFRAKRRQQFLTEKYFRLNAKLIGELLDQNLRLDESGLTPSDAAYAGVFGSSFKNALKLLRLHYTAGEPIESLKPLYADALHWFDEWHRAYRAYIAQLARESGDDLRTDGTPARFDDLFHYQLVLDVLCIGILLGEGDAVRRAAAWLAQYRGTDMLVEYLLETIVADPRDIEKFWHVKPYDPLLDAIYTADTPEQASAFVKRYLDGWYKAFESVPWHDGHLVVTDDYSAYEGYWAFEAAAVCVLHDIDDTSFRNHIVYPKDLADWAREHKVLDRLKPDAGTAAALRCEAGQPCPREGWWVTPAKADSRRHFKVGEVMPAVKTDYGTTIWQWDDKQSA